MAEHELEKLLGGFAADTLTQEEKQALYRAALQDQKLFNALADEQALKELLADPAVRRKLLASLELKKTAVAEGSLSWLDWFRRPAGLAFAGGLAAAALAVVLGIRIYQDSLRQATQSVATEHAKPATPPALEPQLTAKETTEPSIARDSQKQGNERNQVRRQAGPPMAALGKSAEEMTSSADQKLAANVRPPAAALPAPVQAPAHAPIAGAVTASVNARSLFYGGEPDQTDRQAMAQEQEQAMKPLAESAPQADRRERTLDQPAQARKAAGAVAQLKPLGLRYSFVVRGTDGQNREVDGITAWKSADPMRLTVETNQTAYLQVWKKVGAATPHLLLPQKESGQISLKIAAGQRHSIPLPTEKEPVTLTARLSRVPFGPIIRQEAAMFDRLSPHQLQESIAASGTVASQEQATYVVNQDPSLTAQISVEIPLSRQP